MAETTFLRWGEELVRVDGLAAHMPLGAIVTAMAGSGWRVDLAGRGGDVGDVVSCRVGGGGAWVVGFCGLRYCSGSWHGIVGLVIPKVIKDLIKFLLPGLFRWGFSRSE
ncbi:hypothetical protein CYMTET_28828 [Cymbomonas tetramitiformis]|uniref:Uncharacterized protein n=1 Tax=Cymbomonas tetramitiformis TaxID=36881 RepID=A0AAE0FMS4_9CHLO|nr:hypothetical protein CYMTET_28828 [Cymbomonas tetramitiformis]